MCLILYFRLFLFFFVVLPYRPIQKWMHNVLNVVDFRICATYVFVCCVPLNLLVEVEDSYIIISSIDPNQTLKNSGEKMCLDGRNYVTTPIEISNRNGNSNRNEFIFFHPNHRNSWSCVGITRIIDVMVAQLIECAQFDNVWRFNELSSFGSSFPISRFKSIETNQTILASNILESQTKNWNSLSINMNSAHINQLFGATIK